MACSQPQLSILPNLKEFIVAGPKLKAIFDLCIANQPPNHNYSAHDQLFFWKGRLVIPAASEIVQKILGCGRLCWVFLKPWP